MSIELNGTTGIDFNDGSNQSTSATPYGRKNLIINGDMRIAQRATSVSGISSGGTYHTVDRFTTVLGSAGTWTQTQSTDVPTGQGFSTSLKMQCTTASASLSAGAYNSIQHFIEAQNLQHLKYGTANAESITLSFWVKSNKTGTYVAQFLQDDSTGLRTIVKSYTIDSADTWEKKTIIVESDTAGQINNDNGIGLQVRFALAFGSDYTSGTLQTTWGTFVSANFAVGQVNLADSTSNYINITGVQLEVGDAASDFEFMPYDMELARCQRYLPKFNSNVGMGQAYSTTKALVQVSFLVSTRVAPTGITVSAASDYRQLSSGGGGYTTTAVTFSGSDITGALLDTTVASGLTGGHASLFYASTSTAFILFTGCEL